MKRATVPALLLGLFLAAAPADALEKPVRFKRGEWDVSATTSYFTTKSNHTSNGTVDLLNGGSYQLIKTDFDTRYSLSTTWAVFGRMTLGSAESKGLDATRANTSLTDGVIGVQMNSLVGALEVIPEVSLVMPFEKVVAEQDSVMNGEGVSETRLRARMQTVFDAFTLFGLIGLDMRGSGRSNLMPWSIGAEFGSAGTFRFGARLFGSQSISDDSDTGVTGEFNRAVTSARVNAGSLKFYGVNPSVVDSEVFGVARLSRGFFIGASAGTTLSGVNVAQGFHVEGTLTYRFSTAPVVSRRGGTPGLSIDPVVDEFEEDTEDGVDQKLFQPEKKKPRPRPSPDDSSQFLDTAPVPMDQPVYDDTTAPGEDPLYRERKAPPLDDAEKEIEMQQRLDDTEMSIQLKVDKKRKRRK